MNAADMNWLQEQFIKGLRSFGRAFGRFVFNLEVNTCEMCFLFRIITIS